MVMQLLRLYEMLHHVRKMLYRMRRISLLRAPGSMYETDNEALRKAPVDKNRGTTTLGASRWDCECNAACGVGAETEDNSNVYRLIPIGLDDETVAKMGKHVRWAWLPTPVALKDFKPIQRFVVRASGCPCASSPMPTPA
mmetsp:Transcript_40668/g.100494  ORF Transcript_40668/g.100494 Transcript_40668/m.100494 type:complete len:140 (-) Transcript_40668:25-444(-)